MLRDRKNDLLHLLSMLESLEKIMIYSRCVGTAEEFFEYNDQLNFNAVLTLLMHTGETVAKLSDDLFLNSPEIPWEKMRGLRHHIAHDYIGLDIAIVFNTVTREAPTLLEQLYELTASRIDKGILEREALELSVGSRYYRHIHFQKLGAA